MESRCCETAQSYANNHDASECSREFSRQAALQSASKSKPNLNPSLRSNLTKTIFFFLARLFPLESSSSKVHDEKRSSLIFHFVKTNFKLLTRRDRWYFHFLIQTRTIERQIVRLVCSYTFRCTYGTYTRNISDHNSMILSSLFKNEHVTRDRLILDSYYCEITDSDTSGENTVSLKHAVHTSPSDYCIFYECILHPGRRRSCRRDGSQSDGEQRER